MISGATLLILRVQAHYSYLEYRPPSHLSVQVQAFGLHSKLQCSKVQAFGLYSKCKYIQYTTLVEQRNVLCTRLKPSNHVSYYIYICG